MLIWKNTRRETMNYQVFDMSDFEKKFAFEKSPFGSFCSVERTYFTIFVKIYKKWFWSKKVPTCQIFNLKKLQRVWFWIKNATEGKNFN